MARRTRASCPRGRIRRELLVIREPLPDTVQRVDVCAPKPVEDELVQCRQVRRPRLKQLIASTFSQRDPSRAAVPRVRPALGESAPFQVGDKPGDLARAEEDAGGELRHGGLILVPLLDPGERLDVPIGEAVRASELQVERALVSSFVENLVTPLIAMVIGKPDFSDLTFTLNEAVFRYGAFLTQFISFVAVAAAVFFFVVKPANAVLDRMRSAAEEGPPDAEQRHEELLDALRAIRTSLVDRS